MDRKVIYLFCVLLGSVLSWLVCKYYYCDVIDNIQNAKILLVSKQDMKLKLVDYKGKELFVTDIACGCGYGNKLKKGDLKTPEGVFQIADIQNSKEWKHDFKDGKGMIEGAYGPYFIRLSVPEHKGIGIHGTHDSLSIGSRVTEGCIRLKNDDLIQLVSMIEIPMTVVITPSAYDEKCNINIRQ